MLRIGVIGGENPDREILDLAYNVGRKIAKNNCILICGGLSGVMEEVSKGAKEEGGMIVGILPYQDTSRCNPYITIPIVTGIGYARNMIVVLSSQAVIAIDGAYGTLSEIAYALQFEIPVIGLYTWDFSYKEKPPIVRTSSPEEAVKLAIKFGSSKV